jgi:hypothetical protein
MTPLLSPTEARLNHHPFASLERHVTVPTLYLFRRALTLLFGTAFPPRHVTRHDRVSIFPPSHEATPLTT